MSILDVRVPIIAIQFSDISFLSQISDKTIVIQDTRDNEIKLFIDWETLPYLIAALQKAQELWGQK